MSEDNDKIPPMTFGGDFDVDGDTLVSRSENEGAKEADLLPPGSQVGRYLILGQLGRGGMGVVYLAYDPELDRRIALKLLSTKRDGRGSGERLLREAKALARLSHPNVVSAYDVGTIDDDVFVAMELVEGKTLKEWIQEKQPPIWRRVKVMVAAGRGLAAAHRAGLIHRDIKADNIVVGNDGGIRVLDFGLARAADLDEDKTAESQDGPEVEVSRDLDSAGSWLHSPVTLAGAVMGTPGYMAPEQYLRHDLDEKSDQYSFCVTLYEALYGRRPHVARKFQELKIMVTTQPVGAPPAEAKVPARLRRIMLKGLAIAKQDRYPSMDALLAELSKDVRALRRRIWALAAVVLLVAASFAGAYTLQARKEKMCRGAGEQLIGVWDQRVKQEIGRAFQSTGRTYAADTFARVRQVIDSYADDWVGMRTEACEATHLRGEQSESLLDKRILCLDRRLSELKALVDMFVSKVDVKVLDTSVQAAFGLSGLASCADKEALLAEVAPPADARTRQQVLTVRGRLDEALAYQKAGKYADGLTVAQAGLVDARKTNYRPVVAEALLQVGRLLDASGKFAESERALKEASQLALSVKDRLTAIAAMNFEIRVVGDHLARFAEALSLRRTIETAFSLGKDNELLRADFYRRLGELHYQKGNYSEARSYHLRSLAFMKKTVGEVHPDVAHSLKNLGNVCYSEGKYQEARKYYQESLEIWAKTLGSGHPNMAHIFNNLGVVFYQQQKYDLALKHYRQAVAVWEKALGPEHPMVARVLNNIGLVLYEQGDFDEGIKHLLRGLAIWQKSDVPNHPNTAWSKMGLGELYQKKGDLVQAESYFTQALQVCEQNNCEPEPLGRSKFGLAKILWQNRKSRTRAVALTRQARDIFAKTGRVQRLREAEQWLASKSHQLK